MYLQGHPSEAMALGFSIYTQGDTLEELKNNIKDAVLCHFERDAAPQVVKMHFVREEAFSL